MPRNHVVLIHGYSSSGEDFEPWAELLRQRGYSVTEVSACTYQSLTNEVTIKDIAEGFDRALRLHLKDSDKPFDAIVHSTGMLVIRAWLTAYGRRERRLARLKRLIALAPATFGSPLAHKGRSWIGAIFKGSKDLGPDFLEAGDLVLDALELGSRYTWDLAHADLFGKQQPFYGPDADTPYVFVLCGDEGYGGLLRRFMNPPGSDGTVRWAGCALNARKVTIDFTRGDIPFKDRFRMAAGPNVDIPVYLVSGYNHGTILSDPRDDLVELVVGALGVESDEDLAAWRERAKAATREAPAGKWQQFVVRAIDERDDPIPDYYVQLYTVEDDGTEHELEEDFGLDIHTYGADKSYRCFHVDVSQLERLGLKNLWVRVMASSGSQLVAYWGTGADRPEGTLPAPADWDARLNISDALDGEKAEFFRPFTTTLLELRLNREPLPFDPTTWPKVCWFHKPAAAQGS